MKSPLDASKLESLFLRFFTQKAVAQSKPATRAFLREKLRSIEGRVVLRGTIAGFLSGAAAAASVYAAEHTHQDIATQLNASATFTFYFISIGLTMLITLIEILFLYIDSVKACARMSQIAQNNVFMETENIKALNRALVRAGLEIPNSSEPLYGIDPLINRSPLRVLLFSIIYKLKVSMSNAILKFALKRFFPKLAGRALGRSLIEIISAPVFALWNFYLCRSIMKQARIRTLGPLLIQDAADAFWPQGIERANDEDIQFTFSALKETVILCGYFHFNHILLAQEIIPAMEATHLRHLSLNDILRTLPEKKQFHYLKFIALLLVMDGKWSKSKEELLSQLRHRAGLKCPLPNLRQYDQMVCEGEAIVL